MTVPVRPPKPCRKCKRATRNENGYCDSHQDCAVGWQQRQSSWQGKGSTRSQRKERAAVLKRDQFLCQPCLQNGRFTPAAEVDHIVNTAAGGDDSMSNKQAICVPCHKAKTAKESAKAAVSKRAGVGSISEGGPADTAALIAHL